MAYVREMLVTLSNAKLCFFFVFFVFFLLVSGSQYLYVFIFMIFVHIELGQFQSTTSPFPKLTWSPPELYERMDLIGFIVEYKDLCSQEWKRLNKYLVPGPVCLVGGLIPAGDYQFRVTSKYQDGLGPASEPSASTSS